MDVFKGAERLMALDDNAWARHANPWSVYTRFTCLPLIVLAIWSRAWLGWWCVIPIAASLAWTWLNPRVFKPPSTLNSWASKGVLGERMFLNRHAEPVAAHHVRAAHILTVLSAIGAAILIFGLVALNGWAAVCGLIAAILPKLWFVDRMVWLHQDRAVQGAID